MISEDEARARIVAKINPLPERTVPIADALGCFAAQDYFARLPLPRFDNSAMDGYAVMASDCKPGARLRVVGEQPAGPDRKLRISRSEAVRIFTGAPVPAGADAVVMQEETASDGDAVVINAEVESGEFIRRRGCDLAEGQRILAKGERIRTATIALLASQGFDDVTIGGDVRAGVISTGDELVKPGEKITPGQIYDSNSALLQALLQCCGATVQSAEHSRDELETLTEVIKRGFQNDILIVSGGVSVGEHDLVKDVLRDLGAEIELCSVAIKPGKPFLFGTVPVNTPGRAGRMPVPRCFIFGLAGNPVSAFVTFLQFVRPAVLKMMGATNLDPAHVSAKLTVGLTNEGDRPHYIRGRLESGKFTAVGRQESHALFGLSRSNGLLRIAAGGSLKAGQIVDVQIWDL